MASASEIAVAATRREIAEYAAIEALCSAQDGRIDDLTASNGATPGGRRRRDRPGATTASAVLSVRLDYGLFEALERHAALSGIAPSKLARNLIRCGLFQGDVTTAVLVGELESVTARLRAAAP